MIVRYCLVRKVVMIFWFGFLIPVRGAFTRVNQKSEVADIKKFNVESKLPVQNSDVCAWYRVYLIFEKHRDFGNTVSNIGHFQCNPTLSTSGIGHFDPTINYESLSQAVTPCFELKFILPSTSERFAVWTSPTIMFRRFIFSIQWKSLSSMF